MRFIQPAPVLGVIYAEHDELVEESLDDSEARWQDAFWAREIRRPFTWQRWLNWWIARRWLVPRDIRKR